MGKPGLIQALALVVLLASPLAADWLVLDDGTRLETRGPWQERGKLLVFTTTDGTLSSMRLDDIDLDASHRATSAAANPPAPVAPPPPEPKTAAFVLTDADVAHTRGAADDSEAAATATATGSAERLVVTDYQEMQMDDEQGTRYTGTLRNVSNDAATRVTLTALVYDADGELLATANAMLSSQALMPDQQARFQVDFVGVYAASAVAFRPTTLPLRTGAAAGEETEADSETAETPPPQSR
jgi:hypothetical protein